LSIEGSDDEVPTKVDVDLSGSSSAEITLEVAPGATITGRDTLPADSEPTTLEPQMTVRGLGSPPEHPADGEGPTKSVEERLLKAYAAEMQGVEDRRAARHGVKPRAPSLPTMITPSEPFRATPPPVAGAAPGLRVPIEDAEEETVTDTRAAVVEDPRLAPIEGADAVTTSVSDGTPMLSSNELITDPGITDPGVAVLTVAEDDDEQYGSGGTVKIVMTPAAMPVPAAVSILMPQPDGVTIPPTSVTGPVRLSAPPESARPGRPSRGASRRVVTVVVTLALATLAASALLVVVGPWSSRTREVTPASSAVSASSSSSSPALSASSSASASASFELPDAPVASSERDVPPAASAVVKAHGPAAPRFPRPTPRPPPRPAAPPSSSSAQKASTPLHI